ncbi:MAG: phosphate--acyl-ACP acyltransferase, partial [Flavobacteriales bacterium]|nr:phosphate--acyl-ACP acyltransferase [Flavobacteriales bacterium]
MKIGLDIMGGDFAPHATLQGAVEAKKSLASDVDIVLIGDENVAKEWLNNHDIDSKEFSFLNASQVIEMSEHPTRALRSKPDNSISIGFKALKLGQIDVLASAGNSGAMLVGSMFSIGPVPGVIRPCIT